MGLCPTRQKRESFEGAPTDFWEITTENSEGEAITMNKFKDKKAIIVTSINEKSLDSINNNSQLNHIYTKYKNRGLEILVFSSINKSQSKNREKAYTIITKTKKAFNFPVFGSVEVNGQGTHPLFKYLRTNSVLYNPIKRDCAIITKDLTKFLVDRYGNVVKMYNPNVSLQIIEADIEKLLSLT